MGRFFNLGLLKLVLALGILFGLVGLVYYAHNQADKEIETFSKEQKDQEETQAVTVDDYELKEIGDDNSVHWRLIAKKGTMEPSTKDVQLEDVNVNYYKEGKVSMQLNAPIGKANEISRIVILTSKGDTKVKVVGDEKQAQLETKKLELTKNNQFTATGGVNIVWPGVAKVSGNTAQGSISKSNLEKIVIRGNTHASIDI